MNIENIANDYDCEMKCRNILKRTTESLLESEIATEYNTFIKRLKKMVHQPLSENVMIHFIEVEDFDGYQPAIFTTHLKGNFSKWSERIKRINRNSVLRFRVLPVSEGMVDIEGKSMSSYSFFITLQTLNMQQVSVQDKLWFEKLLETGKEYTTFTFLNRWLQDEMYLRLYTEKSVFTTNGLYDVPIIKRNDEGYITNYQMKNQKKGKIPLMESIMEDNSRSDLMNLKSVICFEAEVERIVNEFEISFEERIKWYNQYLNDFKRAMSILKES